VISVAVLGAGGFVGRHIVRELARRGHAVRAWTLESPSKFECSAATWRQVDLDHFDATELAMDVAIHVAEGSVLGDPSQHARNVARAARVLSAPARRVIYASSAVVYGDAVETPQTEDAPTRADSPYAAAKLAVEALIRADERATVVRLANVYGGGMSRANVLSDILAQVGTDGPLRVRDLGPVRDYLHVEDAARGFADIAEQPVTGLVNLGTGRGTSVAELARIACTAAGSPARALLATAPRDRRSVLVLDPGRARRELGWEPTESLEQGITRLVQEVS
jgi:nucleoside-diphosphate-sugar epimerase